MALTAKDYVCGSCAGGEISQLSSQKNAKEAMTEFCKQVLGIPGERKSGFYRSSLTIPDGFATAASHYVFIAGPEKNHSLWPNYGSDFAKFIQDNKLGEVVTMLPVKNKKYHPDTECQIWVWQPNQASLEKWWVSDGSVALKTAIEAKKKELEPNAKALAEKNAKERQAYAVAIAAHTKNGVEPTLVNHSSSLANKPGTKISGRTYPYSMSAKDSVDGTITPYLNYNAGAGGDGRVRWYHNVEQAGQYMVYYHSGPMLEIGKTYKIVLADAYRWVLVEVK